MSKKNADLPAPPALRTTEVDGEDLVILSYPVNVSPGHLGSLTPAEMEVARLVCEGLTSATIAAQREVSYRTVCNQLASIYRKLGVSSRVELVAKLSRPAIG